MMAANTWAIGDSDGAASRWRRSREPAFEPPPWFAGSADRRLAGRAAAVWDDCRRRASGIPDAIEFDRALAVECLDASNFVRLVGEYGKPAVCEAGEAIGHVFGLRTGALAGGGRLAAKLAVAYAASLRTAAPVNFEGAFARDDGFTPVADQRPSLLTRGGVLPLAGPAGTIVAAYAVVTWTEALSTFASDHLRRELASVYSLIDRASDRHRGPWH